MTKSVQGQASKYLGCNRREQRDSLINAFLLTVRITAVSGFLLGNASYAKTAKEIDASVDASLDRFRKEVKGAEEFLVSAKGMLVLPGVIKAFYKAEDYHQEYYKLNPGQAYCRLIIARKIQKFCKDREIL